MWMKSTQSQVAKYREARQAANGVSMVTEATGNNLTNNIKIVTNTIDSLNNTPRTPRTKLYSNNTVSHRGDASSPWKVSCDDTDTPGTTAHTPRSRISPAQSSPPTWAPSPHYKPKSAKNMLTEPTAAVHANVNPNFNAQPIYTGPANFTDICDMKFYWDPMHHPQMLQQSSCHPALNAIRAQTPCIGVVPLKSMTSWGMLFVPEPPNASIRCKFSLVSNGGMVNQPIQLPQTPAPGVVPIVQHPTEVSSVKTDFSRAIKFPSNANLQIVQTAAGLMISNDSVTCANGHNMNGGNVNHNGANPVFIPQPPATPPLPADTHQTNFANNNTNNGCITNHPTFTNSNFNSVSNGNVTTTFVNAPAANNANVNTSVNGGVNNVVNNVNVVPVAWVGNNGNGNGGNGTINGTINAMNVGNNTNTGNGNGHVQGGPVWGNSSNNNNVNQSNFKNGNGTNWGNNNQNANNNAKPWNANTNSNSSYAKGNTNWNGNSWSNNNGNKQNGNQNSWAAGNANNGNSFNNNRNYNNNNSNSWSNNGNNNNGSGAAAYNSRGNSHQGAHANYNSSKVSNPSTNQIGGNGNGNYISHNKSANNTAPPSKDNRHTASNGNFSNKTSATAVKGKQFSFDAPARGCVQSGARIGGTYGERDAETGAPMFTIYPASMEKEPFQGSVKQSVAVSQASPQKHHGPKVGHHTPYAANHTTPYKQQAHYSMRGNGIPPWASPGAPFQNQVLIVKKKASAKQDKRDSNTTTDTNNANANATAAVKSKRSRKKKEKAPKKNTKKQSATGLDNALLDALALDSPTRS